MSPSTSSPENGDAAAASETTPLLATAAEDPVLAVNEEEIISHADYGTKTRDSKVGANGNENGESSPSKHVEDKPLPGFQIFLLCLARFVEPIAFFGVFPFINKMIMETGNLREEDVGFYSGMIESLFSLTQMLLMISWGKAADRVGRKPVLVSSLVGISVGTAFFGLSKAIWQMIFFRCLAGVFAGTVVTVRVMLSENSTPKTQARAFSFFAFSGNLGIFIGPLIGGALADPAGQYEGIFERIGFFKEYPYALSTFSTGAVGIIAAVACGLFLKETLKRKAKGDNSTPEAPMTTWEIIKAPGVANVLYLYCHVMFLGIAYTAVCPVFWFTDVALGGYGFSPIQISLFLASIGISQSIWLLIAFPILQRKYGTGSVLRACLIAWPCFMVAAPLCNEFLRRDWKILFWIVAPVLQIGGSGVAMAFTAVQLALNDISPSQESLGTLNAIALTLISAIRTVGPASFTSIFAAGVNSQFLNGHLVWIVLVLLCLAGSVTVQWLPEKAEGKVKDDDE